MPEPPEPFIVTPEQGRTLRGPAGGPARILADAASTGGAFTALENEVAPGDGPPLHLHHAEDELLYVRRGTLRFRVGEERFDAPAGSLMFIPRGRPHIFQNVGDEPAALFVIFTPAGMEAFFEGSAALPPGPPDPAAWGAIAQRAGMEILGPPVRAGGPL